MRARDEQPERVKTNNRGAGEHSDSAGVDTAPLRASFVPKNAIEFLWGLTIKFGFPALVAVALGWYVIRRDTFHAEGAKAAHEVFKAALSDQTAAVREGTAEQRKMTEALIRLDTKIEGHLKDDDRRHH